MKLPLPLLLLLTATLLSAPALAESSSLGKDALQRVAIEQRIGEQVPLDLVFRDERGRDVRLKQYVRDKPVILALIYNRCPMLCNMVLSGLVSSLKVLKLTPGTDFEVLAVSFDPKEKHTLAARQKARYLRRYGRLGTEAGFHFLTGDEGPTRALSKSVGFNYTYDPKLDQYAHSSAIMVLTPTGKVARYFYGTEYSPRDLRFALVEAADGKIGTLTDDLLLLCYRYDPSTGTYSAAAIGVVRVGGLITLAFLIGFIGFSLRRERRQASEQSSEALSEDTAEDTA